MIPARHRFSLRRGGRVCVSVVNNPESGVQYMRLAYKLIKALLPTLVLLLIPFPAFAQFHYQLTPGISISETYDDNIDFTPTNEISDYITGITPSLNFDILTERTNLALYYAPTFVFYRDNKQYDTTRHLATLTWGQELSRYLRFDLTDTYYRSEQPIEYSDTVVGVRTTRQTYQRNLGDASVSLLFGPENRLTAGYSVNHLKNEDPTINDGRIQNPFGNLAYWFNVKNGVELNYRYTKAEFWNDLVRIEENYTGHAAGGRFIHRFNPHTSAFVRYNLTTYDFDGPQEEYDIHDVAVGIEHAFSPDTSLLLTGGYFIVDFEDSDNKSDPTYDVLFTKRFQRGTFTIGGTGGWWFYGDYIDPQNRGITRYWSGNGRVEYQLAERFSLYVGGLYRLDRNEINREWEIWRGDAGIRWSFLQFFALSLDYRYAQRDDDLDTEDYKNNRVMLNLTVDKLYRW